MSSYRTLTGHQINECNEAITITADERNPKNGNASHHYLLSFTDANRCAHKYLIDFQDGPVREVGTNGLTQEALIAVLIDRLEGFQASPYACAENADALEALKHAQQRLHDRTKSRVARGVEGTHTV